MTRFSFVLRRPFELIPVLIGISLVSFVLLQLTPGDPARLLLGPKASAEAIAQLREHYGLDRPVFIQYFYYIRNVLSGDFGQSMSFRSAIGPLLLDRIGPTVYILVYGLFLSALLTLLLGIAAARSRGGWLDQAIRVLCVAGIGIPSYFVGLLLVLVLSLKAGLFPVSGYGNGFLANLYHMFLPALTIAISVTPILTRNFRATLIQQMNAGYAVAALSKGVPEKNVFWRHVFRNSLLPTVSLFGVVASFLIGGTVVVENVFNVPGLGLLLVRSVLSRDYLVVQGVTLVMAAGIVISNLVIDVVIAALDPRVKT
ncbi:MAG: ABC transporter permease [Mesorhizobium sp.]|uniref:ABC transporter permease n=1 Tax=Mesorhizobium sp. TaxID=1871066 RepID=UPI000FD3AEC2|nr:ABC transporter permease [Mesorhizobium sp.]RVD70664.1 ABC transporter permease [Mesorhizobium sp. M4A.F.Ca.ET.029.04.2.1]TIW37459.1 MAG: ABC transporter permease [Mesorhizobium sp.]